MSIKLIGNVKFSGNVIQRKINPTDISGGIFYYNPTDSSNITLNGTDISAMVDSYPNQYDLAQGTPSKQPLYDLASINGLNTIQSSNGKVLTGPTSIGGSIGFDEITLMVIIKPLSSPTGNQFILSKDGSGSLPGDMSITFVPGDNVQFRDDGNSVYLSTLSPLILGDVYLITCTMDQVNGYKIYVNNLLSNSDPTTGNKVWYNPTTTFQLCSALDGLFSFDGNIGETIAWNKLLSDSQRNEVSNYFISRYNIS